MLFSSSIPSFVSFSVVGVVISYLCLWAILHLTHDGQEPPVALDSIPFLSPLFGLLRRRFRLFLYASDRHGHPIYTLRLPWVRCYVINDSSLISAIDRQVRTISFAPIEAKATAGALGTTDETNEIMRRDPAGEHGHFSTFHKAVRPALSPGPGLDGMVARGVGVFEASLAKMRQQTSPQTLKFFQWVRHEVLMASTEGEYGPGNPFRDPVFENAWFKFLPGVPILATGFFPGILARKSFQARELLTRAFDRYFKEGHHLNGSAALLARQKHGIETGLPESDRARGEVGSSMALVNNTVPSAFWLIFHIYSDPVLLEECRGELANAVRVADDGTRTIDLAYVRSCCPVLNSTLNEVFRYYGIGTVLVRQVVEDHMLNKTYLLKKDGYVLMPNSVQHFSQTLWGPDAKLFKPTRFLQAGGHLAKRQEAALRVFGGGALLCPGRHFAINLVLAFAARVILQFDVRPAKKESGWHSVRVENSYGMGVAKVFLLPENDLEVEIFPRRESC